MILTKMEKVVELTEKELETMVQNKARIDELHVGGRWLLRKTYCLPFPMSQNLTPRFFELGNWKQIKAMTNRTPYRSG